MHDEIGLHCAHPSTDRVPELRRTRHAVPRRKHQRQLPLEVTWESRGQLAPTLAPPVRDDRTTCPRAHPQPEAMHARPAPVVRLEGPLALGHGCLLVASGTRIPHRRRTKSVWTQLPLVSSSILLAGAVPDRCPGRSRIASYGRLFEGTEEISLGQTWPNDRVDSHICNTRHRRPTAENIRPCNVAERLAPAKKTVSFCQCRFDNETATDNEARMPDQS